MNIRPRKLSSSDEFTVEDSQYIIKGKILYNPVNKLHFKVINIDYKDDSVLIECIETERENIVQLGWIKDWKVL